MKNFTHDPAEYIRGLQQILISDKKRIGFLFGAGTSLAIKSEKSLTIPAIGRMTQEIVTTLGNHDEKVKNAFNEIKNELGSNNFNIETILSNLEQKSNIIGDGILNGLTKSEFANLIIAIKKQVKEKVSIHKDEKSTNDIVQELVQTDFAKWIGKVERKHAVEVFTTNYDLLFELGLEYEEVPYYDGFTGSYKPFFNAESVEDFTFLPTQTKLWKIHGSLGWHYNKDIERIVRVEPSDDDILIYPSTLKYRDSKKQPYESLLDRLSNFLKKDDSILITCGYSWGDEHINSRIISALKSNTSSHVIGLIYDKYWVDKKPFHSLTDESPLAHIAKRNSKISIYGNRGAIIGCDYGEWRLRTEPSKEYTSEINTFFDEDAPINIEDSINVTKRGEEIWTGKGEFILTDFSNLVRFLNRMINENEIRKYGEEKK